MEARAINRFVGTSPRKMRLVIDLIRGRGVEDALNILHFSPKHASKTAEKVLRSAIANFQNKDEAGRVDTATLYVKEAYVDGGPMLKRITPAPMGRAYRIRKRSNHITIVIGQHGGTEKPALEAKPKQVAKQEKTVQPEKPERKEPGSTKGKKAKASKETKVKKESTVS